MGVFGVILSSQPAIASSDSGTLTPVEQFVVCDPPSIVPFYSLIGYGTAWGTYSPTGLTGGKTIAQIGDEAPDGCGTNQSFLIISGFSSNPGSSWLTSITCNGVTNLAPAGGYSYSSGLAEWVWSKTFGLSGEDQVSCTIVHS